MPLAHAMGSMLAGKIAELTRNFIMGVGGGIITVSIMCITPLVQLMSVFVTLALFTFTPAVVSIVIS